MRKGTMRAPSLKVFGTIVFRNGKQVRAIVATTSGKRAAELFRIPYSLIKSHGCQTHNAYELSVAMAQPGTVFIGELHSNKDYKRDRAL